MALLQPVSWAVAAHGHGLVYARQCMLVLNVCKILCIVQGSRYDGLQGVLFLLPMVKQPANQGQYGPL